MIKAHNNCPRCGEPHLSDLTFDEIVVEADALDSTGHLLMGYIVFLEGDQYALRCDECSEIVALEYWRKASLGVDESKLSDIARARHQRLLARIERERRQLHGKPERGDNN